MIAYGKKRDVYNLFAVDYEDMIRTDMSLRVFVQAVRCSKVPVDCRNSWYRMMAKKALDLREGRKSSNLRNIFFCAQLFVVLICVLHDPECTGEHLC